MEKIPFNISATTQGSKALIRITGEIGWDTDAELFRTQVDGLIAQGAEDVHIYINSPGGSCFDAAEIVNIISRFKGEVTGEGGALVASAGTFIAAHCVTFEMPENGMFMIHKPSGYAGGTVVKIESYLKLLKDIEAQYYEIYKSMPIDAEKFEKEWNTGDWWMTAKEAKEYGFVSSIKDKVKIDKQASALIMACGCPADKLPIINKKEDEEMDLKATAKALGLSDSATEAEVSAAIAAGKKAQADLEALNLANEQKAKTEKAEKIKAALDKAQLTDKTITGDTRASWESMLNADYENGIKALTGLSPVTKAQIQPNGSPSANSPVKYVGKTFEELQEDNPDALASLMSGDPAAYDELYNDYLKRNKLK